MRLMPTGERAAMFAIYAFCRAVDDIADDLVGDRARGPGAGRLARPRASIGERNPTRPRS